MKKIFLILFIFLLIIAGCSIRNNYPNKKSIDNKLIDEIKGDDLNLINAQDCNYRGCEPKINSDDCNNLGGEVITTQSGYCSIKENFLGTLTDILCPCICCKK